jgi:hypothetical protein
MNLTSTRLVPELQHWGSKLITDSVVNKYGIPKPVFIEDVYMPQKSFIELLFNENYNHAEYFYLYELQFNTPSCEPYVVFNRLQIYRNSQYAKLTNDPSVGQNLFALTSDDFTMLDALLNYRTLISDSTSLDSTSFVVVDATSVDLIFDTTADIWYLTGKPSLLSTPLSKLIWVYLAFKATGDISYYDNTNIYSNTALSAFFEIYLIETMFSDVSARGWTENFLRDEPR